MKTKLIFIYFIMLALVYFMLSIEKDSKVESYLEKHTREYTALYEMHYHQYKQKSKMIFDILVNTPALIDIYKQIENASSEKKDLLRKQLYTLLKEKYGVLSYIQLRQLHFHLPNNESFLRLHKPEKYGDNLTDIRETITYVNKYKKPIDSFEEGRVYSGYRFVFPLEDESKNHLGSVEVSFNMSVFTSEFIQHYDVLSNFHIKAGIVENKVWPENIKRFNIKSPLDGYYMEKAIVEEVLDYANLSYSELKPDESTIKKMKEATLSQDVSTIYFASLEKVITIIPIKNKVTNKSVAFMTVRGDGREVRDLIKHFYIVFGIIACFLLIVFVLLYKKFTTQEKAQRLLEVKVKEEVEKNRRKDMELLKQAKMVSLGEMFGNISHQWKQPLNSISATAISIGIKQEMETLEDKDIKKGMDVILERTQYLSGVIEVFKNYVKGDAKKAKVSVQNIVDQSLAIISASLNAFFIDIETDIENANKVSVNIVKGEVSQVLINILNNAKDALVEKNKAKKKIKISLETTDMMAILSIEDNAGGIPDDIIDKIFDPYFTTKHQATGTGLGLSMSYNIVTKGLGGKLYVRNVEQGAKFFIEIPLD